MKRILAGLVTLGFTWTCFAQTEMPAEDAADAKVIAVVLGKKITVAEKEKLNEIIFGELLKQFAAENKIEPTQEELEAFVQKTKEKEKQHQINLRADRERLIEELKSESLPDQEREQKASHLKTIERILKRERDMDEGTKGMDEKMRTVRLQMAQQFVKSWKINKALYEKYGGRVIFQQAGVEPLDAYRDFLKEQEKEGAFRILDKSLEESFWHYFTNDAMHTFYDKEDGAKFINNPWWMSDGPPDE